MTLDDFILKLKEKLKGDAVSKGYSKGETPNNLARFTNEYFQNHDMGEIVYKCVRYKELKDPRDLEKIAAWAAIAWLLHYEKPDKIPFSQLSITMNTER